MCYNYDKFHETLGYMHVKVLVHLIMCLQSTMVSETAAMFRKSIQVKTRKLENLIYCHFWKNEKHCSLKIYTRTLALQAIHIAI